MPALGSRAIAPPTPRLRRGGKSRQQEAGDPGQSGTLKIAGGPVYGGAPSLN